jgi:ubiquinone/menaquinone biosynthesis C-methylase UbiE
MGSATDDEARETEGGAASFWDGLHNQPRFRPQYPSEPAVRFVRSVLSDFAPESRRYRALDIGCGGGRHTVLLASAGFDVDAVDISDEGLRHTRTALADAGHDATLTLAPMTALPFEDNTFDVAVSYGVFYYGTLSEGRVAIGELHRVLKPGGRGFVVVRTSHDYRHGKGPQLEPSTFKCDIGDTNELGTIQHFLTEHDVVDSYGIFSDVEFELMETTFGGRTRKNSDWLITLTK